MHFSLLDVVYVLASTCFPGPQYGCGLQLVARLPGTSWYFPTWQATHLHVFLSKYLPLPHDIPPQALDVVAGDVLAGFVVVTASSSHPMMRCWVASWCWPSGHGEQLRGFVLLSGLMYWFWKSHFVCAKQLA